MPTQTHTHARIQTHTHNTHKQAHKHTHANTLTCVQIHIYAHINYNQAAALHRVAQCSKERHRKECLFRTRQAFNQIALLLAVEPKAWQTLIMF
jgi:hypothetical protein